MRTGIYVIACYLSLILYLLASKMGVELLDCSLRFLKIFIIIANLIVGFSLLLDYSLTTLKENEK